MNWSKKSRIHSSGQKLHSYKDRVERILRWLLRVRFTLVSAVSPKLWTYTSMMVAVGYWMATLVDSLSIHSIDIVAFLWFWHFRYWLALKQDDCSFSSVTVGFSATLTVWMPLRVIHTIWWWNDADLTALLWIWKSMSCFETICIVFGWFVKICCWGDVSVFGISISFRCLALGCVKKQHKEQKGCSHDTLTVVLWLKRGQVTDSLWVLFSLKGLVDLRTFSDLCV